MTSSTRSSVRDERRDTLLLPLSVLQSMQPVNLQRQLAWCSLGPRGPTGKKMLLLESAALPESKDMLAVEIDNFEISKPQLSSPGNNYLDYEN